MAVYDGLVWSLSDEIDVWAGETGPVVAGATIAPTDPDDRRVFIATSETGETGLTEPDWDTPGEITDGTVTWVALPAWEHDHAYSEEDEIQASLDPDVARVAGAIAGTSGSVQPDWTAAHDYGDGPVVVDTGVVWEGPLEEPSDVPAHRAAVAVVGLVLGDEVDLLGGPS